MQADDRSKYDAKHAELEEAKKIHAELEEAKKKLEQVVQFAPRVQLSSQQHPTVP